MDETAKVMENKKYQPLGQVLVYNPAPCLIRCNLRQGLYSKNGLQAKSTTICWDCQTSLQNCAICFTQSKYFVRNGTTLKQCRWGIGNVYFSYATIPEQFYNVLKAFNTQKRMLLVDFMKA